ncbi:MAG: hypothetical protein LC624_04015, partial [Halobacteriales archaeon]|nr:hypothetical protein [Halobacteriales archaeon]
QDTVMFAKPRQFAWKTLLLALITLALAPIYLERSALAAQLWVGALLVVHVSALAVFILRTRKEDIAPTPFGLAWRAIGLLVAIALLSLLAKLLVPESAWFWPTLGAIWVVHTAGLTLLHVRAVPGAPCPFVPSAWRAKA